MLNNGLYEQVLNKKMEEELSQTDKVFQIEDIDAAEASKILAKYVQEVIQKKLDKIADEKGDIKEQVDFVNDVIGTIASKTADKELSSMTISDSAKELLALFDEKNSIFAFDQKNQKRKFPRPETSLAESSLFTGAQREPQMFSELKKEILSSDRIDMLVSFIKWSGLRLIMDELRSFTQRGGRLRVITTSYMGATDVKAVEELSRLPNTEIKISYDTKRTRL